MDDDILVSNHHLMEDSVELTSASWEQLNDHLQYNLDENLHQQINFQVTTDIAYQRHESVAAQIEPYDILYFQNVSTIPFIIIIILLVVFIYLVIKWWCYVIDKEDHICSLIQQSNGANPLETENSLLLLTNRDYGVIMKKRKSTIQNIYSRLGPNTITERHDTLLQSHRFHDRNLMQLHEMEKELKTEIRDAKILFEYWLNANKLNHYDVHLATYNISKLEKLNDLYSKVISCQNVLEHKLISYIASQDSLRNLIKEKLQECGDIFPVNVTTHTTQVPFVLYGLL